MDRQPGQEDGQGAGPDRDPGLSSPAGRDPARDHAGPARDPRLAVFAAYGEQDGAMPPGPVPCGRLAVVADEVSGPERRCPGATDNELIGVVRAWAAIESWAAAAKLGAIREMIRRDGIPSPGSDHGDLPETWSPSLRYELAAALACSTQSAETTALLAWELRARLPGIAARLEDGTLTQPKARAIADTFQQLMDADAATAEAMITDQLAGKTYTQVLRLAEQAALTVDPALAERRREQAQKHNARVTFFREQAGTAALSGRDLPPDEALAAMATVNARAEEYKESDAFGDTPMDVLRAYAYLDLIMGAPAAERIATADPQDDAPKAADARSTAWARSRTSASPAAEASAKAGTRHDPGGGGDDPNDPNPDPGGGGDANPNPNPGGLDPGDGDGCPCSDCDGSCCPCTECDGSCLVDDDLDPDLDPDPDPDLDGSGHGDGGEPGYGNGDSTDDRQAGNGADPPDGGGGGHPNNGSDDDGPDNPGPSGPGGHGSGGLGGPGSRSPGPGPSAPPLIRAHGRADNADNADNKRRPPDLIVPLATLLGLAERPGEIHGFGLLDPGLARQLAAAVAASSRTSVCVTVTSPEGYAIGHGCARPTRTLRRTGAAASPAELPARLNLTVPAADLSSLPRIANPVGTAGNNDLPDHAGPWAFTPRGSPVRPGAPDDRPRAPDYFGAWALAIPGGRTFTVRLEPVPTFSCDHRYESRGYQPGDQLRHLVQIRDGTCTFPPCNRHARESDFEHGLPYDQGGRTCTCNAGARSRACHRVKQSPGWSVTQPKPGWHRWETPSGRVYVQEPKRYPA